MVWIKYIIGEVLDKETNKRSEKYGYRVGRECFITVLEEGSIMIGEYEDGRMFYTSVVEDIEETDYGIWVTTENRVYRFDDVRLLGE